MATQATNIVGLVDLTAGMSEAATSGHLTNHGAPVLTAVQVQAVFWGAGWNQAAQSALIPQTAGSSCRVSGLTVRTRAD